MKQTIKKIDGVFKGGLDIKRGYLPGVTITAECPDCHEDVVWDGRYVYISYPKVGEPQSVHMYCEQCECEFEVVVVLTMSVTVERHHE